MLPLSILSAYDNIGLIDKRKSRMDKLINKMDLYPVGIYNDNIPGIASEIITPGYPKHPKPETDRNFIADDEVHFPFFIGILLFKFEQLDDIFYSSPNSK
jgi:hypothetical protein